MRNCVSSRAALTLRETTEVHCVYDEESKVEMMDLSSMRTYIRPTPNNYSLVQRLGVQLGHILLAPTSSTEKYPRLPLLTSLFSRAPLGPCRTKINIRQINKTFIFIPMVLWNIDETT